MRLHATNSSDSAPRLWRDRARAAGLPLVVALALAACSGGASAESAAPAPSPGWDPIMAVPGTDPLPGGTANGLRSVLDDLLAESGLVGATAAVVSADGVWRGAAGTDPAGTDLTPQWSMALASITKTFTAAAVMGLVQDGRVELDAPIDTYVELPFATDGATVRQVLNMRSGFPTDVHGAGMNRADDPDRSFTIDEVLSWHAGAQGSDGQLGGEQRYKNLNYTALGAMVEELTGQSMAETVRSEFLDPAGLEQTWYQDAETPQPPLSNPGGAAGDEGPWLPSRSFATAIGPAGGMAGSAADAARWGYLLYGGFLLRPDSVAEMTGPEQPSDFYGLGTELFGDRASVGHGGDARFYHALLEVYPEDDLSIAIAVPWPQVSRPDGFIPLFDAAEGFRSVVLGQ